MKLIMPNVKIPSSIIPMVEFSDEVYLLCNKYLKDGLSAVGRVTAFFEGPSDQIYTKEAVYTKSLGAAFDTETPVVYGGGSGPSVYREENGLLRYESQGKSRSIINGITIRDVAAVYQPIELLYKGVGYDIMKVRGVAANTIHLYTISTMDGTAAALATAASLYTNYKYMDEDTGFVYFWAFKDNGKVNIIKFDKTAKTSTVITTVNGLNMETGPKATFYTKNVCIKPYKDGTKTYVPVIYVNASNAVCVRVIVYDSSVAGSDISTKVTYADYTLTGTITLPVTNVSGYQYYFRDDGILVIGHVIWGVAIAMGTTTIDMYGLYTLQMNHTDKTATVLGYTQAANLVPLHYMIADDSNIYAVTAQSYAKLEWDSTNKKYIKVSEEPTGHISIGLESRGNLYYTFNKGSEVALAEISPFMVDVVEVLPVGSSDIRNTSFPLESAIKVRAKAATGELLARTVTLIVSTGPVVFKANSLKTIDITTSETDFVTVPIMISSTGESIIIGKVSGSIV